MPADRQLLRIHDAIKSVHKRPGSDVKRQLKQVDLAARLDILNFKYEMEQIRAVRNSGGTTT